MLILPCAVVDVVSVWLFGLFPTLLVQLQDLVDLSKVQLSPCRLQTSVGDAASANVGVKAISGNDEATASTVVRSIWILLRAEPQGPRPAAAPGTSIQNKGTGYLQKLEPVLFPGPVQLLVFVCLLLMFPWPVVVSVVVTV